MNKRAVIFGGLMLISGFVQAMDKKSIRLLVCNDTDDTVNLEALAGHPVKLTVDEGMKCMALQVQSASCDDSGVTTHSCNSLKVSRARAIIHIHAHIIERANPASCDLVLKGMKGESILFTKESTFKKNQDEKSFTLILNGKDLGESTCQEDNVSFSLN